MKKWLSVLLVAACSVCVVSCGSDDDDDADSNAISGSSILQVVNQTPVTQEISFDGTYIGDVAAGTSRNFSVPDGQHTVTGYDDTYGTTSSVYTFVAGRTTTVTYAIRSARHAADAVNGVKIESALEE